MRWRLARDRPLPATADEHGERIRKGIKSVRYMGTGFIFFAVLFFLRTPPDVGHWDQWVMGGIQILVGVGLHWWARRLQASSR